MCNLLALIIAEQGRHQAPSLSPAQVSMIRVLDACIHGYADVPGFMMQALTAHVNADLASRGERYRLNERKLGDILTSLSFTNRTRKNTGYVLWLDRSDRARIHAAARDYGVEGTAGGPIESCGICIKASAPASTSVPAETPMEKEAGLEEPKGEGRERRERRSRGTRSRVRASTRVHSPRP